MFCYIDEYIQSHHLTSCIYNHGVSNNVNEIYNAFDVLLFPSINEGAGLVLYEALANGLTCIVSENVPIVNLKTDKIIRLPLEERKWINTINRLKEHRNFNRDNALTNSTYDVVVQTERYLKLYKSIINDEI